MERRLFILAASLLLAVSLTGPSSAQADTTYSGRAYAAFVNTILTGPVYVSDTGELPPGGDFRSDALLTTERTPIWGVLQAEVLPASTSGASGKANSSASLFNAVVLPGSFAQVTASLLRTETTATCSGASGSSEIADLTFGGNEITVTGQPNQTVTIPPVGGPTLATLIINEQTTASSGTYRAVQVNALHLIVPGVAEVVLSSAKSDINCQPPIPPGPCHDFVSGGGWINSGNSRANFGFHAGFHPGASTPVVHLNYIDHYTGRRVRATSITAYGDPDTNPPSTRRHFEGAAEVDGTPGHHYAVDVDDKGEPGREDTFYLQLDGDSPRGGTLQGGNIQLHKPCP